MPSNDFIHGIDVTAIAAVLEAHGHNPPLAEQWARAGRRPELVDLYCRVGIWHPDAADAVEHLGLGPGDVAHHQPRSLGGDTVQQLDDAIAWYESGEATESGLAPADLAAARGCLEAVRARHLEEATTPTERLPLPWDVDDDWLPRYEPPRVRAAVILIETTEGVIEVWPDNDYIADPEALAGDGHRSAPCRLHHGVRLDDHDASSILEDFLDDHPDAGWGNPLHWEDTAIYLPHHDGRVPARVGLVFDLAGVNANWRYTPTLLDQIFDTTGGNS